MPPRSRLSAADKQTLRAKQVLPGATFFEYEPQPL